MGMFDYIRVAMPLPVDIGAEHRDHYWQTKSLACELGRYEIREDGTIWQQAYDTEDRSDPVADRFNCRWVQLPKFTGEITFYDFQEITDGAKPTGWLEFSVYLSRGVVKQFELIEWTKQEARR